MVPNIQYKYNNKTTISIPHIYTWYYEKENIN